jgi:hypothetical protein
VVPDLHGQGLEGRGGKNKKDTEAQAEKTG